MRTLLLALACGMLVLLAGCKSDPTDSADGSADADSTPLVTATAAEGSDSTDSAAAEPTAADQAVDMATRYIGNTGGSGVAVRSACEAAARTGAAWADATQVAVLEIGEGACDGWSFVAREGSLTDSWVRNIYLLSERPAVVARPPSDSSGAGGSTPPPSGSTPPTPAATTLPTPVITYPQLSASPNPVHFGEIFPGNHAILSVVLSNTSLEPVTILSVRYADGSQDTGTFTVSSNCDNFVVSPRSSCRVVARFTAHAGGNYQDTLFVTTSSATAPLAVTVLGVGFVPD